jgi:hypothetical protein
MGLSFASTPSTSEPEQRRSVHGVPQVAAGVVLAETLLKHSGDPKIPVAMAIVEAEES